MRISSVELTTSSGISEDGLLSGGVWGTTSSLLELATSWCIPADDLLSGGVPGIASFSPVLGTYLMIICEEVEGWSETNWPEIWICYRTRKDLSIDTKHDIGAILNLHWWHSAQATFFHYFFLKVHQRSITLRVFIVLPSSFILNLDGQISEIPGGGDLKFGGVVDPTHSIYSTSLNPLPWNTNFKEFFPQRFLPFFAKFEVSYLQNLARLWHEICRIGRP